MRPRRVVECIGYLGSITFALVIAAVYFSVLTTHSAVLELEKPFFYSLFIAVVCPAIVNFSKLSRVILFVCTTSLVFFSDVLRRLLIDPVTGTNWSYSPTWIFVHDSDLHLISIALFPLAMAVAKHLEIRRLASGHPSRSSTKALAVSFIWAGVTYASTFLSTSRGMAGVYAQIALLVTLGLCTFHLGLVDINLYKLKRSTAEVGSMKKEADS